MINDFNFFPFSEFLLSIYISSLFISKRFKKLSKPFIFLVIFKSNLLLELSEDKSLVVNGVISVSPFS